MNDDFFVHAAAICESAAVGRGTRIWAFAHIMEGVTIGTDCNIGDHSFVEAGAVVGNRVTIKNGVMIWEGLTIEDDVFVGPGVVFTNDRRPRSPRGGSPQITARYQTKSRWLETTRVCRGAAIGARAVVLCGIEIGAYAMVAAGAVVTRSVGNHALVAGHPAEHRGWVCECGGRLAPDGKFALACMQCDNKYTSQDGDVSRRE